VQTNKGHGGLERRELWVVPAGELHTYLDQDFGWPVVRLVGQIRRYRRTLHQPAWESVITTLWLAGGAHKLAIAAGVPPAVTPTVTAQPTGQAVNEGGTVTFTAAANGFPTPAVQWQASADNGATWNDIAGANAATMSLHGAGER
jgi:hypothetical protein